jgi:hypothetical protein
MWLAIGRSMDWMNPDIPSSHQRGWGSWEDGTKHPTVWVHQWSAQWRGKSGDVVLYDLRYDSPLTTGKTLDAVLQRPDNDVLRVAATRLPKAAAERLMSWAARQQEEIKNDE